jgi:hypothetical protein
VVPDPLALPRGCPLQTAQKLGHAKFGDRDLYALDLRHYEIPPGAFGDIQGHFIA